MTWEQIFKIPKGRGGGSKHHNVRIDDRPPHTRDFSRELGGFFLHLLMTYGII